MEKIKKITCIIPAFNEEKRIGNVLSVVEKYKLIDQIIVVNDDSSDKTSDVVKKFKSVELIELKTNIGKTGSVVCGLKKSRNDIVMFLDSDLMNLTEENLSNLLMPVLDGKADVSISIRSNSLLIYKMIGLDFISGERVFDKSLLNDHNTLEKLTCFGLEVYMNSLIIKNKMRIKVVNWKNVSHARKSEKLGFFKGTLSDFSMIFQMIKTIGFFSMFYQIIKLKKLKVK